MKAKNVPGVMSPWMTSRPPYQITSPMPIAPMSSITGDDSSDTQDWRKLILMIRAFSLLKRPVSCFSVAKALMTRMPLSSSCNMLEMLAFTSGVLAPVPPQGPAEQRQREPGDGQDDDGPARQFEVLLEHHVQQADHGDHLPDDLYERGQALPDHAHVVDDARHERPDLRFLIEMQGQGDDFLEQFLPHGFQHVQRAVMHTPVCQVAPGTFQGRQYDEGQRHIQKGRAVLPDEDVVERGLDQPCRAGRSPGNDGGSQQRDDHGPFVGEEIPEHPQSQPEFFPAALGAFLLGLFLFTHSLFLDEMAS